MIAADLWRAALAATLPFLDQHVIAVYAIAFCLSAGSVLHARELPASEFNQQLFHRGKPTGTTIGKEVGCQTVSSRWSAPGARLRGRTPRLRH